VTSKTQKNLIVIVVLILTLVAAFIFFKKPHLEKNSMLPKPPALTPQTPTKTQEAPTPQKATNEVEPEPEEQTPAKPAAALDDSFISPECEKTLKDHYGTGSFAERKRPLLDKFVGHWYYESKVQYDGRDKPETSYQGKFLLALAKAHLLSPQKVDVVNEAEALALLYEVIAADPTNSAPVMYAALLEHRKKHTANEAALLKLFTSTNHFNNYFTEFSKEIYNNVNSLDEYVAAIGVTSETPVPDYKALRDYVPAPYQKKLALQLMSDGLNPTHLLSDVEWMPLSYATGKSLMNKVEPKNKFPKFSDVMAQKLKNQSQPSKADEKRMHDCDFSGLEPLFSFLKERLR
jgi:hypothetical protein